MRFTRKLYEKEEKYLLSYLERIEGLYSHLVKFPTDDIARFIPDADVEEALARPDLQTVGIQVVSDIFNHLKFFWYTNTFKAIKLIEALISSYNQQNYLAWTLVARSTLEYSAVFYYFHKKLDGLNPCNMSFAISQLQEIVRVLKHYSHGTRFNWTSLLAGSLDELLKNYKPSAEFPDAVNVLTALSHLRKSHESFREVEVAYALFSDFSHPNMGSHTLVIDLPGGEPDVNECRLALNPNSKRGEFIMVATLSTVEMNLRNIVDLMGKTGKIVGHWYDVIENGRAIEIDWSR